MKLNSIRRKGMAKDEKSTSPPANLEVPTALFPIMKAFSVGSRTVVKAFVVEATQAIYQQHPLDKRQPFSDQELNGAVSIIQSIQPKDALGSLYAAQIVVCHLIGLRKLSQCCSDDQRIGLKLLHWSSKSMEMFVKKQNSDGVC